MMRSIFIILITLAIVVTGVCSPLLAQEIKETVLQVRSFHDPAVPDPDVQWCWDNLPPGVTTDEVALVFPLGASLWSLQTRASDGVVINEQIVRVGTVTACAFVLDPGFSPFSQAPFFGKFAIGELGLTGSGKCIATSNNFPGGGPVLVGCSLDILPENSTEGIKWGIAVSNSVFNPFGVPGFQTGSFWSIHLYWE